MKLLCLTAVALAVALSGCAQIQEKTGMDSKSVGAGVGAAAGCAVGAVGARLMGKNPLAGCAVGAVAGGLIGFQKARQEEMDAAARAQQEAVAALANLPVSQQARMGEIKTVEVTATDKGSNETKKYQAFDSVSVDLPLSTKGSPEYDTAIGKLKTLAERVADERGSAIIELAMTAADARASKVVLETASAKTAKGSTVTVAKIADNTVPKGMQRVTVRAGKIQHTTV